MKILITGGAGFIASHIANAYLDRGHEVVIVDNLKTGRRENIDQRAMFYEVDIRHQAMNDIVDREKPDLINHHAAQMDVRASVADPKYDADVNLLGFLNLMQLAVRHRVKKVIFASTGGAIYGEQDYFPADENHPCRPLSPYGITKFATEKYLYFYQHAYNLPYVVLRYANVYGPRQNPHGEAGVVAIFAQRLLRGDEAVINGDGKQTRDFVFISDVVQANVNALGFDQSDIFNIGTGHETDINAVFQEIAKASGSSQPEIHAPAKPGEQQRSVIDSGKARAVLGWQPTIPLVDGIRQTVDYFRKQAG